MKIVKRPTKDKDSQQAHNEVYSQLINSQPPAPQMTENLFTSHKERIHM